MKIKKVPTYFRVLDYLLFPLMWILCGCKFELPQETHRWHMRNYHHIDVPKNKSVRIEGDDKSKRSVKGFPFYHIPLFGGWKNYVILEVEDFGSFWNLGWIVEFKDHSKSDRYQVQASRIYGRFIKVLKGINDSDKIFFAIKKDGSFANIKLIDHGRLGEGKYRSVRLF